MPTLPPWRQGDNFRRTPHQALVDQVNELASLVPASAEGTLSVYRTPFGSSIVDDSQSTARTDVTVKVTEAYAGGGKYGGQIMSPPTGTLAKTGDLAEADEGSTTDAIDCIIYYAREQGQSTHLLVDDPARFAKPIYNGRLIGVGEDNLPVVLVTDGDGRGFFPVGVYKTSGVAGAGATPGPAATCSFVYALKTLGGTTVLATGKTPDRPRLANVTYATPADGSVGMAYYDGSGSIQLYEAVKEFPGGEAC